MSRMDARFVLPLEKTTPAAQPPPWLVDVPEIQIAALLELVGKAKEDLFYPRLDYVPVANFRERVGEVIWREHLDAQG